jgi:L-ribulose-5-phosphate 3-epimerase
MTRRISLNGSSFVGEQANYQADWAQSVAAVNAYYQPLETFEERFDALLKAVTLMGFHALDIWTAGQLNWAWALPEHLEIAARLLDKYAIQVTSLGGAFGETFEEFESACRMAIGVNTTLLSGTTPLLFTHRAYVIERLHYYKLRLAIENHPERTPQEMLAQIGDGANGVIGTAIDTGWYATQGYDPAQAIYDLREHLLHIHLKDVLSPEHGHVNVGYGAGVVPIERCLEMLNTIGYSHDISVENHTTSYDPTEELKQALNIVKKHL